MDSFSSQRDPLADVPECLLRRDIDIAELLPAPEPPDARAMRIVIIGASELDRTTILRALQEESFRVRHPVHSVLFVQDPGDRLKELASQAMDKIILDITNEKIPYEIPAMRPEAPKITDADFKPFRKVKQHVPDRPKWTFDGRPKGRRYI